MHAHTTERARQTANGLKGGIDLFGVIGPEKGLA